MAGGIGEYLAIDSLVRSNLFHVGQRKLALQHASLELLTSLNPVRCQHAHMRLAVESILGLSEEE